MGSSLHQLRPVLFFSTSNGQPWHTMTPPQHGPRGLPIRINVSNSMCSQHASALPSPTLAFQPVHSARFEIQACPQRPDQAATAACRPIGGRCREARTRMAARGMGGTGGALRVRYSHARGTATGSTATRTHEQIWPAAARARAAQAPPASAGRRPACK